MSATNNYNKKNMQKSMPKIRVAEKRGKLNQGGTIVKGTAGSTGIRHTAVANARCLRPMVAIQRRFSSRSFALRWKTVLQHVCSPH